jgi:hypothetical protein
MHTYDELLAGVVGLARRVGERRSTEDHELQDREFRSGHRTEVRRTINDSPLRAVAFLEELRRAAEEAQLGLIAEMGSTAAAGPTLTELGAALDMSKQSGRKRAAAAGRWSEDHELPNDDASIEDFISRYPSAERHDDNPTAAAPIHWPDDTSPHPDLFGNPPQTQEDVARKALAMGIGISVNR